MKKPTFEDAQQMKKNFPQTFEAPSQEELDSLKINDSIKVAVLFDSKGNDVTAERFWVLITKIENDTITGTVDNDLVKTVFHGLKLDDTITFEKKNIYSIYPKNEN
jgi:DNA-binding protein YbaB